MTLVKICGITNLEDALAAVEAGADMLGFNFYSLSPRFINAHNARQIIQQLPAHVTTVGVFVNEPSAADVARIADEAGVKAVQLHGDESPTFCEELKNRYVIKALRVNSEFNPEIAVTYKVEAIMLDGFDKKLRGGTGKVFDWSIAQKVGKLVSKLFLAGGLTPDNITDAINLVRPYAVDACSALETLPGKKDARLVELFIHRVKVVAVKS